MLLHGLTSEIRVRTYDLPLATYPASLGEAARLLDEKKTNEASNALMTALNTLVVIDRVTPLPLLVAQAAIDSAQADASKDKNAAQALLGAAKAELERQGTRLCGQRPGICSVEPVRLGTRKAAQRQRRHRVGVHEAEGPRQVVFRSIDRQRENVRREQIETSETSRGPSSNGSWPGLT